MTDNTRYPEMPRRRRATPEEQAAMREIWPNGLPPESLNARIKRELGGDQENLADQEDPS